MPTRTPSIDPEEKTGIAVSRPAGLPVTRDLTLVYVVSLVIALIVAVASVTGILFGSDVYVTDDLIQSLVPVDAFSLVIVMPILLGSMWLARRGKLIGLLCWPGALLYVLYRYMSTIIGVPFGVLFLPYLALVALSMYTTIGLVASIDGKAVRQRLTGRVPARVAGGILVGVTCMFVAMNASAILTALASRPPGEPEHPVYVLITDFTTLIPACLIGGFLLWRRQALGYVAGAGLLLVYSLLLVGPIPILVYQASRDGLPIPVVDTLFLLVIASITAIPLGLFARGIIKS